MSTTAPGITAFPLVILPVSDQDRSIAFYEGLGLEKLTDQPFAEGALRWVEVYVPGTAPGSGTGIALAPPPPNFTITPHSTGVTFRTDDIDAAYAAVQAAGADIDTEIMRSGEPGVPHLFGFRDPDGYGLMMLQMTGSEAGADAGPEAGADAGPEA